MALDITLKEYGLIYKTTNKQEQDNIIQNINSLACDYCNEVLFCGLAFNHIVKYLDDIAYESCKWELLNCDTLNEMIYEVLAKDKIINNMFNLFDYLDFEKIKQDGTFGYSKDKYNDIYYLNGHRIINFKSVYWFIDYPY